MFSVRYCNDDYQKERSYSLQTQKWLLMIPQRPNTLVIERFLFCFMVHLFTNTSVPRWNALFYLRCLHPLVMIIAQETSI